MASSAAFLPTKSADHANNPYKSVIAKASRVGVFLKINLNSGFNLIALFRWLIYPIIQDATYNHMTFRSLLKKLAIKKQTFIIHQKKKYYNK